MTPSVRTERLELRPLQAEDRAEFIRVHRISHEHFAPWMPASGEAQTPDQAFEADLNRALEEHASGTGLRLVATLGDGTAAGFFSLSQVFRRAFQNAYAGWRVSADQAGHGIATEGVAAMLDVAFAPAPMGLGLHRIQANVIPTNGASVRVAEKVGFRLEGRAKAYLRINGTWQDHLMFAKTSDEHSLRYLDVS